MANINGKHTIFVIYDHPSDVPYPYVARMYQNGQPTEEIMASDNLWTLRVSLAKEFPQMVCLGRHDSDDKVIIESWM